MFLNNSLIQQGICNGTIGIVTNINKDEPNVHIAFCTHGTIVHQCISWQTSYFYAGGQRASHTQFPLQNAFSLTVHKTQSVTLPKVSLHLANLFAYGRAYVAINRSKTWNNIQISALDRDAFLVDPEVIEEYTQLERIAQLPLSLI